MLLAINLNLELLADGAACGGDAVRLFDGAQQGVQQARSLIGQLLAFARRQPLTPASFDLSQVIIETAPILRRTLPATIAIETSMGRHLWPVFADQNQLVTALLNLAVNARDAMPQGGRLLIEAANAPLGDPDAAGNPDIEPGDYVSIGVSDTGWGMDPAVVERAFEPFFTTKQSRGTGLGLSQVYGYARQSGGHVAIDSTPGAGTKVTLYLPRSLAEPRAGTPVEPVAEPVRGETILVVEDTLIVRQAVARMLSDLGYRVIAAATGRQALAVLETAEPLDLLFTDVVLPGGISGDELAAMARRRRPGLQVLLTSGYAEMAAAPPVSGGLGAELLPKPYTRAELTASLRRALSGLPQAA